MKTRKLLTLSNSGLINCKKNFKFQNFKIILVRFMFGVKYFYYFTRKIVCQIFLSKFPKKNDQFLTCGSPQGFVFHICFNVKDVHLPE